MRCQWFALCTNEATVMRAHPVLNHVPCCARCYAKADALGSSVCSRCNGKGFVNPNGTANNAFAGSDRDPLVRCSKCGGTGR